LCIKAQKVTCLTELRSIILPSLADNSTLFYNDLRQFGYLQIVPSLIKEDIKNKYGLEPLTTEFSWLNFQKVLQKKKGILKSILLDQKIFSGIGNIYADEICFRAGILPSRRVESLSRPERKKIYQACQYIIAKAVEQGGTTFSDYRTTDGAHGAYVKYLKVYGRAKKPCQKCKKTIIQKYRLAGRGTHFCSSCQS
jgi:formamidopyrimidine-DNA glycosylase